LYRCYVEEEKAAMHDAHPFQNNIIQLDVGGHKFTTSLQTLTSVPDTYLASLFSGRFQLTPNADGAYFIDRDGRHFRHVLNYLREPVEEGYKLSAALEAHRDELVKELEFYGLLDRMLPAPAPKPYAAHFIAATNFAGAKPGYYFKKGAEGIGYYVDANAQELIAQSFLRLACVEGTKLALTAAVSQSRALVFEIGSVTPFLTDEFQDLRFVITDRVVNRWPVWAVAGSKWFIYRTQGGETCITDDSNCPTVGGRACIRNAISNTAGVAPTELPSDKWYILPSVTLSSQYASAQASRAGAWSCVPNMRIKAVHGLGDDNPAMVEALAKLAAFA
jgi:hypothetical protein